MDPRRVGDVPRVDERYDAPLPAHCPDCGGPVVQTGVVHQYQEELPVTRVAVRQFDVYVGRCDRCGHRVQGRPRLQTSDAIGAAAAQLGPQVIAPLVVLNTQLGLSVGKIVTLLRQRYGLTVTRSGLVHAVHRAARQARPTYDALCAQVRGSPMVSPDETGWKVGGHLQWLWAFATSDTTVYRIQAGRGFAEAAAVLGADLTGSWSVMAGRPIGNFPPPLIKRVWHTCCADVGWSPAIIRARPSPPTCKPFFNTRWRYAMPIRPVRSRRTGSPWPAGI